MIFWGGIFQSGYFLDRIYRITWMTVTLSRVVLVSYNMFNVTFPE